MLGRDRRPVAMAAGHIDTEPHEKVRPLRKQVLVVVTASWQVLAFDHNLALMWEAVIEEHLPRNARPAEVAVLITSHQVRQGSRGLVIVGGSLELGDMAAVAAGEATVADTVTTTGAAGQQGIQGNVNAAGSAAAAAGEGKLLESVLQEELRFEAAEAAKAHGGAGITGRTAAAKGTAAESNRAAEGFGSDRGVDVSRHFNYHAFEGGKGEMVWKHASGAFQQDLESSAEELRPQDDFRIHADALASRHYGELSCREFRESLLAVMPQEWTRPLDSHLEEALFVKHKEGAGQQKQQLAKLAAAKAVSGGRASHSSLHPRRQRSYGLSFSHIFGQTGSPSTTTYKAARQKRGRNGLVVSKQQASAAAAAAAHAGMAYRHTHLAHNGTANAVVAHVQDGVEVVHLYSGRTLCKLHLPPHVLHADINADGVIDHVALSSGGAGASVPLGTSGPASHAALGPCMAVATSGIPPRHTLWRTHVCAPHRGFSHALDANRHEDEEPSDVQFAPPVFLPVPRSDGTYSHLRGQHGIVVVMSNGGAVTALNGRGQRLWQRYFETSWQSYGDAAATPTLLPLALRPHSIPTAVLAVGFDTGVVISEHGNELAAFHVAFPPVAPAVIADFDGDTLNDVIIVTRSGVFGYAQVQHLGGLSFGALLLTLIVAMAIVWYSQQYEGQGGLSTGSGSVVLLLGGVLGPGAPGSAARARKLRSTEYVD
eukprot:GHRR01011501.1.p1 GENE.GHRR01011501.1~~GHRR01011501.1.p1  ORF type:complete len:711 (+),score=224.28 GHRR01011501.1:455-2587(+)